MKKVKRQDTKNKPMKNNLIFDVEIFSFMNIKFLS